MSETEIVIQWNEADGDWCARALVDSVVLAEGFADDDWGALSELFHELRNMDEQREGLRDQGEPVPEALDCATALLMREDELWENVSGLTRRNALELALAGADPGAMGGHAGLLKRLRPGARVRVKMTTGAELVGEIRAMGRYDFALKTERAELVVPKHAVVWWELLATGDDAHLSEPQGNGELNDE